MVRSLPWHGEPKVGILYPGFGSQFLDTPQSITISQSASFEAFAISLRHIYLTPHILASELTI
jgi:hypothetical protein